MFVSCPLGSENLTQVQGPAKRSPFGSSSARTPSQACSKASWPKSKDPRSDSNETRLAASSSLTLSTVATPGPFLCGKPKGKLLAWFTLTRGLSAAVRGRWGLYHPFVCVHGCMIFAGYTCVLRCMCVGQRTTLGVGPCHLPCLRSSFCCYLQG